MKQRFSLNLPFLFIGYFARVSTFSPTVFRLPLAAVYP